MTVQMIASKPFRLTQEKGFRWVADGEPYEVPSAKTADHHEITGRGTRAEDKPAKTGKGA